MHKKRSLRETVIISALPTKVWAVITDPHYTRQYYFDDDMAETSPNGRVAAENGSKISDKLKVMDMVPGLFFKCSLRGSYIANDELVLLYELIPAEGGIELKVTVETNAMTDDEYRMHIENWKIILQKIKWLAEFE